MPAVRIGVATCAAVPNLDEDGELLLAALAAADVEASPRVWDDPRVDWGSFDAVLVRSTWDYPLRRDAFLRWSRSCRRTANPGQVLEWNTDKHYLEDLATAGVRTVPTLFLPPGAGLGRPGGDYVVKPAVSGSAADTGRFRAGDDEGAHRLVGRLHAHGRTVMVQPYLDGIDTEGETSLIYLGGVYSHAVRREPLLTETGVRRPVVVADVLSEVRQVDASPQQRRVAESALAQVPGGRGTLTYARVDLIPADHGPVVLELEATDCFLFLSYAPAEALDRMVAHLLAAQ